MPTTVSTTDELIDSVNDAGPGAEIVVQGGTYDLSGRWNIDSAGSQSNQLVIRAADGETPHLRFAAGLDNPTQDSGIKVNEPYVTVRGLEISDSGWKGIYAGSNGHDVVFEDLNVHHCNVWGIMNNGNDNVVFRNCDSHDNMDPQNEGQNSDGINMTGPANDGLIEGCRAWNNGDDGFDFWVSEDHTVRDCWAWNNGQGAQGNGNGFKLGSSNSGEGGGHLVHNCVSFGNHVDNDSNSPGSGFWWNGEDDKAIEVYNCTAWDNGVNFAFRDTAHVLKNNISYQGPVDVAGDVVEEANTWNTDISDPGFQSTNRSSDGFLRLTESSSCRDAGVHVGLANSADRPDLGAFPYDGEGESGSNRVEVDGETTLVLTDEVGLSSSRIQSEHSGFNGSGYVNFVSQQGASARWPLQIATPGQYNYKILYANGGSSDRTAVLDVGDTHREITFPRTDGWANWSRITGTIDLPDGAVDLTIETTGQDAGNVDQIVLQPADDDDSDDGSTDPPTKPTGETSHHGYSTPEAGQSDWHVPLNENFEAIDADVPVVDLEGAKGDYEPTDGTLYIATDTGAMYVGDGSQWNQLGTLN